MTDGTRRLILMRHAQAEWQSDRAPDFDRDLNRRGIAEVAEAAKLLRGLGSPPDLILASAATRTRRTAEAVLRAMALPERRLICSEKLYLASPEEIFAVAREVGPMIIQLLLVGHNPGISEAAQRLVPGAGLSDFDTGALCEIQLELPEWTALGDGSGREARYLRPRGLFELWT